MCSAGGVRRNWTSREAFQQINSILDQLADDDLSLVPAESMGDDQIALQRIGNRVQAEGLRRLRRFDSATVRPVGRPERAGVAALAAEPDRYGGV